MSNTGSMPAPEDKEQAEGDRETVEQAIEQEEAADAPGQPTVEQEIAEGG